MVGPEIGYAIGAAGVVLTFVGQWVNRRERLRARPVVIAHEDRKRHFTERGGQAASVWLSNESAASAFNIRFGVILGGTWVGWKHDQADEKPSRVNVLRPHGREPDQGSREVVIPAEVLFALAGSDPDEGRAYWAVYESSAGDWWYTINPEHRSDDLVIRRVRSRRWGVLSRHDRQLARRLVEGQEVFSKAMREWGAHSLHQASDRSETSDEAQRGAAPPAEN